MLQQIFITINEWIIAGSLLGAAGCFLWGMISVLISPCHMASIPLIIAYVGGQKELVHPKQAVFYAVAFAGGLFITIAFIGIICAVLGRMLGDVGTYWQVPVGLLLVWAALGMMGVEKCTIPGTFLNRIRIRGLWGAVVLGLAYGILSGSCTFGFIAPILAIITVQEQIFTGVILITLFAAGHCLPIVIAGSSTATARKFLENGKWQGTGWWFRKCAGVLICLLGIYFIINPFITA